MALVNWEEAYDNVNWKILFNIVDIKNRNFLFAIYKKQEVEIKINSTTKIANIQKEVRQSCPLFNFTLKE